VARSSSHPTRQPYVRAGAQFEEARALSLDRHDPDGVAGAEYHLGLISLLEGHDEAARRWLDGCVRQNVEMDDKRAVASCLAALAALAVRSGDAQRAAELLGAVEQVRAQHRFSLDSVEHEVAEEAVEKARWELGDASFEEALAAGRAESHAPADPGTGARSRPRRASWG
jgi:non-specific serine/threonine protein kinase